MTTTTLISVLRHHLWLWSPEREQKTISQLQALGLLKSSSLINALSNEDPNIRLFTIDILSELDPIQSSLPALINALKDPDRIVRISAVEPVARFGREAKAAIPVLETWLDDDKIHVGIAAAVAIGMIDPQKISEVLPVLINGLESRGDRTNAAFGIGELGEMASEALPLLENLLADDWASTRCVAAASIHKITGDPAKEISVAIDLLGTEDWVDRCMSAEHLGCLGPTANSALWDLRRKRDDENPCVRTAVEIAIERIGGEL